MTDRDAPEVTRSPGADAAAGAAASALGARVDAHALSLRGPRGWVYRDIDLAVPAGRLTALAGQAGSGRTALLLTLGGRMRPTAGTATIGRHRVPGELRAVQRVAALGVIDGVSELDPALTVGEHVGEAMDLRHGLFAPMRRKIRRARIQGALDRVGLELDPTMAAGDLLPDEVQLLGAALALVGRPELLLLDDVDAGLAIDAQRRLWERLRAVADSGVTVIATCHDPRPARGTADAVRLPEATS